VRLGTTARILAGRFLLSLLAPNLQYDRLYRERGRAFIKKKNKIREKEGLSATALQISTLRA
jgi:hypothetical protein